MNCSIRVLWMVKEGFLSKEIGVTPNNLLPSATFGRYEYSEVDV